MSDPVYLDAWEQAMTRRSAPRMRPETWARVNACHDRLRPSWPPEDDDTGAWLGWLALALVCGVLGCLLYVAFSGWRW